jgi:iron complex outermembrane receptor protein
VRTPSIGERFASANILAFQDPGSGMNVQVAIAGNPAFQSEYLTAYEAGHRFALGSRIYADLSLFWNEYKGLSAIEDGLPQFVVAPFPHVLLMETFQNAFRGHDYGGELTVNYVVTPRWKLNAGFSRVEIALQGPANLTMASASDSKTAPHHTYTAGSRWDLRRNLELDAFVYHTAETRRGPASIPLDIPSRIPAYLRADLRLGWRPCDHLEVSVGGQNLLTPRHLEQFSYTAGVLSEVRRTVIGSLQWSF